MERVRKRDKIIEKVDEPNEAMNHMGIEDKERAREIIREKAMDDDAEIIDVDASDSYETATSIRDSFRNFL